MKEKTYFLNPLVILTFMLVFSFFIIFGSRLSYLIMLSFSLLISLLMNKKAFIKSLISYIIIFLMSLLVGKILNICMWLGFLYSMLLIFMRLAPVWILASLISKLNSSELLACFRKMKMPESLSLGTVILFRFLPEFFERLKEVREGRKVRGYTISLLRPIRSFELVIVPLIFKALSISDTLSAAIISKGIEYECVKIPYRDIRLSYRDYLALASLTIFTIGGGFIW